MLQPIQYMEYRFQRGFGESKSHFGGKGDPKQDSCQGNDGAPPTWLQVSTLLINAQKRCQHGITIKSPISKQQIKQIGILYVDNTNLWAGLLEDNVLDLVAAKGQEGATRWGELLL